MSTNDEVEEVKVKYTLEVLAYKPSGKYYTSEQIQLGEFKTYPADKIFNLVSQVIADPAKFAGLSDAKGYTISFIVLDNTINPICLTGIIKTHND